MKKLDKLIQKIKVPERPDFTWVKNDNNINRDDYTVCGWFLVHKSAVCKNEYC